MKSDATLRSGDLLRQGYAGQEAPSRRSTSRLQAALECSLRLRQTTLRPLTIRTIRNRLLVFIRYLRKPHMTLKYIALSGTDLQLAYEQALATLKTLNAVQPKLPATFTAVTPATFDELFQTLIQQLETLRRDARHTPQAPELKRFVKRLCKTRDDLAPFLK